VLEGDNGGCVALQDCNRITLRKVVVRNFNGDGISWQICHDVVVEDCRSHDHSGFGLHPGSGSQRSIVRGNKLHGNDIGLFICWGVRGGIFEKNLIEDNRRHGVSIGHRDTDNVISANEIRLSGKAGLLFRAEDGPGFAPDRNKILQNTITDSGEVGIDVHGTADGLVIAGNRIVQTETAKTRIGLRIEKSVGKVELVDNEIKGHGTPLLDRRK
jgi:nitrous oxidase accessory protein NosD